jgi:non-ribosomal peptide synthetase component F
MTGKNKTRLVGWHPSDPALVDWLDAEVERRGGGRGAQSAILDEALEKAMNDTAQPARTSRDGDPCPSWCVTDHAQVAFHGALPAAVDAPAGRTCHVRMVRYPARGGTEVWVSAGGMLSVSAVDAASLAALIEELGAATPDEHAALADVIRQAALTAGEAG